MLLNYKKLSEEENGEGDSNHPSNVRVMNDIEENDRQMEHDNLRRIKWSKTSLPLSQFVEQYTLPQIVQVEEGFYGGRDDNSLSSGQVLKIHVLSSERKVLCIDRHEKEVHIPLHTVQRVMLKPSNYDTVYQKVSDLAKEKPLPAYVEVTRGYYNVNSNVDYELSVEPGEKLRVLSEDGGISKGDKKSKHMSFENAEGVDLKIPYDCVAGFKPLVDLKEHSLADLVVSKQFPFCIEFVASTESQLVDGPYTSHYKLGVLECRELYDEELIIASCGYDEQRVVFTIPRNLKVTVKVAVGTLSQDPDYDSIRHSYHNFIDLEENVARERGSKFFRASGEIEGFTYPQSVIAGHVDPLPLVPEVVTGKYEPMLSVTSGEQEEWAIRAQSGAEADAAESCVKPTGVITAMRVSTSAPQPSQSTFNVRKPLPDKLDELSVSEVCDSLRMLNLGRHVLKFQSHQIDGALLAELDDEELKDLDLNSFERKKLLKFIKGWRPKDE